MSPAAPRTRLGIFILLRRLRLPLTVLIIVYAVAVGGFTLIPGTDPGGQPWTMGFLHAFYFVSFLGTTIGLGEIPYPFSDAQRLWATAAIYGTVVSWLYAIGALLGVLQDPLFRSIVHENRVLRMVKALRQPFYLVCGYDDAGNRVVRELATDRSRVVVIDTEPMRVDTIDVEDLPVAVPALHGDASDPKTLLLAGLTHPCCAGVLALTGDDRVNTKIALTARLLNPDVPVLCAAREHLVHARMAAAGAEHIINPFDTFAERVALSIRTPSLHVIYESLTAQSANAMAEPPRLPTGRWLLCGSGLFIRTLRRQLQRLDIPTTVVDPELTDDKLDDEHLCGDPTDPAVLKRAGIEQAEALVAGTAVDIDNLAIVLAGRAMQKDLYIVARQTQRRNNAVFRAAPAQLRMLSGYIVAAEVLRVIRAPQLATFLRRASSEDEAWAAALLARLREVVGEAEIESWSVDLTPAQAPTVCDALAAGQTVTLRRLMRRSNAPDKLVHAVPLLLHRGKQRVLCPSLDLRLAEGDAVLCCGDVRARTQMRHHLRGHALPPLQADEPPTEALEAPAAAT